MTHREQCWNGELEDDPSKKRWIGCRLCVLMKGEEIAGICRLAGDLNDGSWLGTVAVVSQIDETAGRLSR